MGSRGLLSQSSLPEQTSNDTKLFTFPHPHLPAFPGWGHQRICFLWLQTISVPHSGRSSPHPELGRSWGWSTVRMPSRGWTDRKSLNTRWFSSPELSLGKFRGTNAPGCLSRPWSGASLAEEKCNPFQQRLFAPSPAGPRLVRHTETGI